MALTKKYWKTSCPQMKFPVNNLVSLVELLRGYIGVMTAPYDIIITSPRRHQWKLAKGVPLERRYCVRIEDETNDQTRTS